MPGATIDRLSLRLSGVLKSDAERLATLVAERLADMDLAPQAELPVLRMTLSMVPGTSMKVLSEQIVAQFLREMNRTL